MDTNDKDVAVFTWRVTGTEKKSSSYEDYVQKFRHGSIFCRRIDPEDELMLVEVLGCNTRLHISTASLHFGIKQQQDNQKKSSGMSVLHFNPNVDTNKEKASWVSLCPIQHGGTNGVVSGLNLSCTGPTKIGFKVTGTMSMNVFGNVMQEKQNKGGDNDNVLGVQQQSKRKRSNTGDQEDDASDDSEEEDEDASDDSEEEDDDVSKVSNRLLPKVTHEDDSEEESSPQGSTMSKKQRKKLAMQKAQELADVVNNNNSPKTPGSTKSQGKTPPHKKSGTLISKPRRLPGGILVRDVVMVGSNTSSPKSPFVVKAGRKVKILYTGTFPNDKDKVFDKNWDAKSPLTFRQGTGKVIVGLERGIEGMTVGGERTITIPPQLGYGAKGSGDVIPPNATLEFHVRVVGIGGK